ncbi:hypothetical protein [Winogradskyella poriferorum]|uniref:hypothetical protein n=1 Tax=Winogradskyella poriferorum TaxID=307627 RepID=UPI003D66230F
MKFTTYYSSLLKSKGVPNLTVRQYQKIFNIMILETRIDETNKLLKSSVDPNTKFILNKRNYSLYSKLHNLIRDKCPEDIFRDFTNNYY